MNLGCQSDANATKLFTLFSGSEARFNAAPANSKEGDPGLTVGPHPLGRNPWGHGLRFRISIAGLSCFSDLVILRGFGPDVRRLGLAELPNFRRLTLTCCGAASWLD